MEDAASTWLRVSIGGLVLGIVLAVGGWIWNYQTDPADIWSPEQAKQLQAAERALHDARSRQAASPGTETDQLKAAQRRLESLNDELQNARDERGGWGRRAMVAGLVLTITGGIGYLAGSRR
jgi:hypothetical protein